jgi:GNAT superfamily N-acetyltransferase
MLAIHDELVCSGVLARIESGGAEERAWLDCELASFAENRLGATADPRTLDDAQREDWLTRATTEPLWLPSARSGEACYWVLDCGKKAGTIALATSTLGGAYLHVSSLYVLPAHRGRSLARTVLASVRDVGGARDLGLRLSTHWTWQRALRVYLRLGMWVRMWKRDLDLRWVAGEPTPLVTVDDQCARLAVLSDDRPVVLCEARRDAAQLMLVESPKPNDVRIEPLWWDATSTLSVWLALHGWPLVRSNAEWERCYYADAGPPESLAYKITTWEAWDRKHGWRVETPRIPGLEYPTWDEFEARWQAELEKLDLGDADAKPGG